MGLLKAVGVGFLIALLIGSFADHFPDNLESAARWASFSFGLGEHELIFSLPTFVAATLFCWIFIFGWRD